MGGVKRLAVLVVLALVGLGVLGVGSALSLAGDLDPSFGGGQGVVTHSVGDGRYPSVDGIAMQADGSIVVLAATWDASWLARYLPNGTTDTTFGDNGYVQLTFVAQAVAVQPDGKIVVSAGQTVDGPDNALSEFTVARYNPDGSPDTSFGTNGSTTTVVSQQPQPGGSAIASANALAVLPDGDILAAGTAGVDYTIDSSRWFVLARYTPDGSLDSTFGDDGVVQTSFTGGDWLGGIVVWPDGTIVAAGAGYGRGHGQELDTMVLARYEPDGSLDPGFGSGGKVMTRPRLGYDGGPPTLQNGKIVVAGSSSAYWFPVLGRFRASGGIDPTFGNGGFASITRLTGRPTAVLSQPDGKLILALYNPDGGAAAVARLLPDGRLDPHFGTGGVVWLFDDVSSLALDDGEVLVGGRSGELWTLGLVDGGNNCIVPGVYRKTVAEATAALRKSDCGRSRFISKHFSSSVARGRVISTREPRGTRLDGGYPVELVVSAGKRR